MNTYYSDVAADLALWNETCHFWGIDAKTEDEFNAMTLQGRAEYLRDALGCM